MSSASGKAKKKTASSKEGDVRLSDRVNVSNGKLQEVKKLADPRQQKLLEKSLILQQELLNLHVAVPIHGETICKLKSTRPSGERSGSTTIAIETTAVDLSKMASSSSNGMDLFKRILPHNEFTTELAAVAAASMSFDAKHTRIISVNGFPAQTQLSSSQVRREYRRQRQKDIQRLLDQVNEMPPEFICGVRIRRKYVDVMRKKFGRHPQPVYENVSETTEFEDTTTESEDSQDEDDDCGTTDVYNSSRINGKRPSKQNGDGQDKENGDKKENDSMDGMLRLVQKLGDELQKHTNWQTPDALTAVLSSMSECSRASKPSTAPAQKAKINIRAPSAISKNQSKKSSNRKMSRKKSPQPKSSASTSDSSDSDEEIAYNAASAGSVWSELQDLLRSLASGPPEPIQKAARRIVTDKRFSTLTSHRKLPPIPSRPPPTRPRQKLIAESTFDIQKRLYCQAIHHYDPMNRNLVKHLQLVTRRGQYTNERPKSRHVIPKTWLRNNFKEKVSESYQVGDGPYGIAYYNRPLQMRLTAHDLWVDEKMINRGYFWLKTVRAYEKQRVQQPCPCRAADALLFIHLFLKDHSKGFLSYLCEKPEVDFELPYIVKFYARYKKTGQSLCWASLTDECNEGNFRWRSKGLIFRLKKYHSDFCRDACYVQGLPPLNGDFAALVNLCEKFERCEVLLHRFAAFHGFRVQVLPCMIDPNQQMTFYEKIDPDFDLNSSHHYTGESDSEALNDQLNDQEMRMRKLQEIGVPADLDLTTLHDEAVNAFLGNQDREMEFLNELAEKERELNQKLPQGQKKVQNSQKKNKKKSKKKKR